MEKHGASNEGPYINLRPLLGVSLPYPLALPSPLSSGSVIDRLQQLRPPTALSSFGDTLSVLIRTLIGSPAPVEQDQGQGQNRGSNKKIFFFFSPCFYSLLILFVNSVINTCEFFGPYFTQKHKLKNVDQHETMYHTFIRVQSVLMASLKGQT